MIKKALFDELLILIEKEKKSIEKDYSAIMALKGILTKKEYHHCIRLRNQESLERKVINEKLSETLKKLEGEMR